MGTSGLPDIYTQSLRAEGVYIRQVFSSYIANNYINNTYFICSLATWGNTRETPKVLTCLSPLKFNLLLINLQYYNILNKILCMLTVKVVSVV